MNVTKRSIITGMNCTIELDVTAQQLRSFENREENIETIFPNLTQPEKDFINPGIGSEELPGRVI